MSHISPVCFYALKKFRNSFEYYMKRTIIDVFKTSGIISYKKSGTYTSKATYQQPYRGVFVIILGVDQHCCFTIKILMRTN